MTVMKKLALIILALLPLVGCSKLEVNETNIQGEWGETYEDYPYYASEGFVSWNFKPDGTVDIHVYDVFAGDSDTTKSYTIGVFGDNVISLNIPNANYTITKLTKKEMEWQMVGTTFQKGTVGSEFKHFTRK
jgi:hypothetical protein